MGRLKYRFIVVGMAVRAAVTATLTALNAIKPTAVQQFLAAVIFIIVALCLGDSRKR